MKYFRQNAIEELPDMIFSGFPSLKFLQLSSNKLKRLPASIKTCVELERIYINSNDLKKLPVGLDHLSNLKYLNASDNKLQSLPSGFIDRFGNANSNGKCCKVRIFMYPEVHVKDVHTHQFYDFDYRMNHVRSI